MIKKGFPNQRERLESCKSRVVGRYFGEGESQRSELGSARKRERNLSIKGRKKGKGKKNVRGGKIKFRETVRGGGTSRVKNEREEMGGKWSRPSGGGGKKEEKRGVKSSQGAIANVI